jgi:AraC-like DNA-binding protein
MRYLTLADMPTAEQFPYWREVICQTCTPLAAERERGEPGITGWVRAAEISSTHCAEVCSGTQSLTHGPAEIQRMASEDVFVSLQLRGDGIAAQGGRIAHLRPGTFTLLDTTEAYRLHYRGDDRGEWQVLSFRVPRARLVPMLSDPHGFSAVPHDGMAGGIAAVAASTMTSIWRSVESLDALAARAAEDALITLLAAAVAGAVTHRDADAALRAAAARYIAANLHESDLNAARVAARLGVSVRKLHGLYAGSGQTFARTVMSARLGACARELSAGVSGTLTDTATRWGFSDLSHLNRVFRARYGCLPSEFRA